MRCVAYCTANSYNFRALLESLRERYKPTTYRDVIHVPYDDSASDVFYFNYGAIVLWEVSEAQEKKILEELKPFELRRVKHIEHDEFEFTYGNTSAVHRNQFVLQTRSVLTKLAISYALAQCVKLTIFEQTIDLTITSTTYLAEDLAKKGKISLTRKEISQKIGELFIERNSINIHSDILDTPELFWEYDELEPLYQNTAHYLDIKKRADILNRRLDIVAELLHMLSDELKHKHSSALEWVIIWLILLEVIMAIGSRLI